MIQYIPGIGEQLAPAISQMMAGINHAIDPDYALRESVKQHLAINPELLQGLANAEAKSPGVLQRLGLGSLDNNWQHDNITKAVAGMKPDAATQFDLENRPAIEAARTAALSSQTATDDLNATKARGASKVLATNPVAADVASTQGAIGMTPEALLREQQSEGLTKAANEIMNGNSDVTIKNFMDGTFTPFQQAAIMAGPQGAVLREKLRIDEQNRRDSLERLGLKNQNAMAQLFARQAFTLFDQTHAGSPAAFMQMLQDPKALEKGRALAQETDPAKIAAMTPEDKALADAASGFDHMGIAQRSQQLETANKNLISANAAFRTTQSSKNATPEELEMAAGAVNGALAPIAALSGTKPYSASYEPDAKPGTLWGANPGIVFRDPDGHKVPEKLVYNIPLQQKYEAFKQKTTGLPHNSQKYAQVMSLVQKNDPELYTVLNQVGK